MTHIQMACYALIASAFILAGLLLVQLQQQAMLTQQAQAEMVINRTNYTLMTTRTKTDEEALFVINNITNRLLIYTTNAGRRQINLVGNQDLLQLFQTGGGGGGGGTTR